MGTVVSKARIKLQGGTQEVVHELESHGHVGVGQDLDQDPQHPLPRGIVSYAKLLMMMMISR